MDGDYHNVARIEANGHGILLSDHGDVQSFSVDSMVVVQSVELLVRVWVGHCVLKAVADLLQEFPGGLAAAFSFGVGEVWCGFDAKDCQLKKREADLMRLVYLSATDLATSHSPE